MHSSIFVLAAALASVMATPSPQPTGTMLPLGAPCDPSVAGQCANGAACYAVNSMLIPSCGNFQATCTSDSQCAFNTCNGGFCNGLLPSSPSSSSSPQPTDTKIPLGEKCDLNIPGQCENGADCYASNFMLIPSCGNFQATCSSDAQCAFNTCNMADGLCNGEKSSTSSGSSTVTPTTTPTIPPSSSSTSSTSNPTATGTIPLGGKCDPSVPDQCANGADCYAVNSMLIPYCGNLQASCTSDAQCAFNTCNNGLCNGILSSATQNSSIVYPSNTNGTTIAPLTTANTVPTTAATSVRYVNQTSTLGQPTGLTTSVVVVGGQTSTIANGPGGPTATPTGALQSNGARKLARGFVGLSSVAIVFAVLL